MRHNLVPPFIRIPVAGLLSAIAFNVSSQEAVANRSLSIYPSLAVTQTFTDNRLLSRDDRQAELITQISPSLHFNRNSGRIRGHLDYSFNTYIYARDSAANNFQNSRQINTGSEN